MSTSFTPEKNNTSECHKAFTFSSEQSQYLLSLVSVELDQIKRQSLSPRDVSYIDRQSIKQLYNEKINQVQDLYNILSPSPPSIIYPQYIEKSITKYEALCCRGSTGNEEIQNNSVKIQPVHPDVPLDDHRHQMGQICQGCKDLEQLYPTLINNSR